MKSLEVDYQLNNSKNQSKRLNNIYRQLQEMKKEKKNETDGTR